MEWSRCGNYIFYITVDKNERPFQLWRHQLGTNTSNDALMYEEVDETFILFIQTSQSEKFIFIQSISRMTSEIHILDSNNPLGNPQVIDERREGILYFVEHWGDDLLILTNEQALNFKLLHCPINDFEARKNLIPYNKDRFLEEIHPFADSLLITGREHGTTQIWFLKNGTLEKLTWEETLYTVSVITNQSYETNEVLIHYESSFTTETTYPLDLSSYALECLQVDAVSGEYGATDYQQEQL